MHVHRDNDLPPKTWSGRELVDSWTERTRMTRADRRLASFSAGPTFRAGSNCLDRRFHGRAVQPIASKNLADLVRSAQAPASTASWWSELGYVLERHDFFPHVRATMVRPAQKKNSGLIS